MAESIVGATMRLSVLGDAGRIDLVVPVWVEVADVARSYAETVGLAETPVLRRATGAALDPESALDRAGLRHGSLLLAGDSPRGAAPPGVDERGEPLGPDGSAGPSSWLVDVAAIAVVVGAVAAALGTGGRLGTVTTVVLLVAGLVALVPLGRERLRLQRLHAAPFCLAGSALVATSPSLDHPLLPVAVAAVAALAAAGAARALSDDDAVSLVWLWSTGLLASSAVVLLVLGAGPSGFWALLVGGGLVGVRLLPALVVDVSDDTLLDLETLAVTAWSAHDEPRRGQRRPVIRRPQVRSLARRGGVLLRTGTAGAVAVLVLGAFLLLPAVDADGAWSRIGAQVMVGAAAGAAALVARDYRDWRLQVLLRVGAGVLAAVLARSVLPDLGDLAALLVVLGAVAVAGGVVAAALALGHGWRSVWWARVADVLQGALFAVALTALPLASGLFDFVWRFTS